MITILDAYTTNPGDLDWHPVETLAPTTIYDRTPAHLVIDRAKDAEILVINKIILSENVMAQLPALRAIFLLATGYDNVDIAAAKRRNIQVSNVAGYSTDAVVQHTLSLILELTNRIGAHWASVAQGDWVNAKDFSYTLSPIPQLAGKTIGIFGFGKIGTKLAFIAQALGMKVLAAKRNPVPQAGVHFVDPPTLFAESDILTLHAPLTDDTLHIINTATLATMRPDALLINTARGGLIDEQALATALIYKTIAGAALDVLSSEPPKPDNPLLGLPNCIITPHIAWASVTARKTLIKEVALNIEAFLAGKGRNVVG